MSKEQNERDIECPWCHEEQVVTDMPSNMIMAFNCVHCNEPVVIIQGVPVQIDKEILESGDIMRLQEYILDILESKFDIPSEITRIDITDEQGETEGFEDFEVLDEGEIVIEEDLNESEQDSSVDDDNEAPITKEDIRNMKKALRSFKVPRNGEMFE